MKEMEARYRPETVEQKWIKEWEKANIFHSEPDERQPYTIVMPPPNVTGVLHMGHVLDNTLQDILIRRARMLGYNALWVPGTDHASIATEAKVVAWLKSMGIEKRELTREEFLKYAWEWKEKHENIIITQLKKLGVSCDWQRKKFTMDPDMSWAVIHVFVELHRRGLIYRDLKMINWDPVAQTALSDEEVVYKEVNGKLYYVKYPIVGVDKYIVIATTRPETIVADTAIAVNPEDERYKELIGKMAIVPVVNRKVPIIADEYVDPEFGTGALKVTPAHDPNDFEIGRRHNLELIDVMNPDATMNENAGPLKGLSREAARKKIVEILKDQDLLEKVEDITHSVGFSERTDVPIEPRLSKQWFVKMKPLAEPALKAVLNGEIKFIPDRFINTYRQWMENIHDWCISRQLWWGHRIPVWYVNGSEDEFVVAHDEEEAYKIAREKYGYDVKLEQDPDVLDTWFSSWLWPLSVFNYFQNPDNEDFKYYYPTTVLVTGPDIIFFWVARMIMAGYAFANEKPFRDVYFHGIIRDKLGRKMSKSLGNSPDVLKLIDDYGADSLRMGVLMSSPAGNDLLFDEKLIEQGRNFANKLWNAIRLILSWEPSENSLSDSQQATITWFEWRLNEVTGEVNRLMDQYRLSEALKLLYSLTWDDFASWFLEAIKPKDKLLPREALEKVYEFADHILRLLHPFIPMITEELWHRLPNREGFIATSNYPTAKDSAQYPFDDYSDRWLKESVSWLRRIYQEGERPEILYIRERERERMDTIRPLYPMLYALTQLKEIREVKEFPEGSLPALTGTFLVAVQAPALREKELQRLQKEKKRLNDLLQATQKKLSNQNFISRAPKHVVEREKQKAQDIQTQLEMVEEQLERLLKT